MAYMEGKRYQEAFDAIEQALSINRKELLANDVVAYNIGLAMQLTNKIDEAMEIFSTIKDRNPSFPGIDQQIKALAEV